MGTRVTARGRGLSAVKKRMDDFGLAYYTKQSLGRYLADLDETGPYLFDQLRKACDRHAQEQGMIGYDLVIEASEETFEAVDGVAVARTSVPMVLVRERRRLTWEVITSGQQEAAPADGEEEPAQ